MDPLSLPQLVARLDGDRLRRYREHLDFYHGQQWTGAPRRRDRRLTFNYARAMVDKVTSYLMTGLDFAVDPTADTDEARALAARTESALRRVWDENNLDQLDFETELDAAILGDAAFKVTWDPHGRPCTPDQGADSPREGCVRVTAPDVQGLFAWWRGDDPARVWRVASRYYLAPEEAEALFQVAPAPRSGGLSTVVEGWTESELEIWLDERLIERGPNPYGFIPFVLYPNLREAKAVWGVSDLAAIIEPARELNRALSQLSHILELSGNPIAVLENVTDAHDIAVAPGAVWEIPPEARAYLLDLLQGGGVRLHVEYIDLIYRTLHDLGESPRTAFGENRGGLSGVALNTELDPLLKKVQRKRLIRSAAYRRRNEMILRLLDRFAPTERAAATDPVRHTATAAGTPRTAGPAASASANGAHRTSESSAPAGGDGARPTGGRGPASYAPYRTRIVWGPVLPQDRSRQVTDERALVAAGIHSRRRAADALGVEDPDAEFARWLDEQTRFQAVASDGMLKADDARPNVLENVPS